MSHGIGMSHGISRINNSWHMGFHTTSRLSRSASVSYEVMACHIRIESWHPGVDEKRDGGLNRVHRSTSR